jgi:hypothetical protein
MSFTSLQISDEVDQDTLVMDQAALSQSAMLPGIGNVLGDDGRRRGLLDRRLPDWNLMAGHRKSPSVRKQRATHPLEKQGPIERGSSTERIPAAESFGSKRRKL